MCGIIGYLGNQKAVPILINGLKRLEYRGYDSAGICVEQNNQLKLVKKRGDIKKLENVLKTAKINGNIGIGHSRWATHGKPNELNAHPHLDCKKEIAIVHNGIIENYQILKELLKKQGHQIISGTDSEIFAHLIEKFYKNNLEQAVRKALKLIEGAFALAVIKKNEDKIIAVKKGSPLILGLGKSEMFLASDVSAILNHSRKAVYLNDNEIAVLKKNNYFIENLNGKKINKKIHQIKWTISQIEKKGFKHFMLKEIFEQPEAVENTLRGRIRNNQIKLTLDLNPEAIKKIIIIACGTSWHSALIAKYLAEKLTKIPVEIDYASEFRYRNPIVKKDDLVIAISQSGETADTLAALREAKSKGAKTLGIVNVVGSSIAREVDSGIYLHAGPEIGVASTKAFVCQLTALLLLALYLQQEKGMTPCLKILKELKNIPVKIKSILKESEKIKELAEKYKQNPNFLYLGRGLNFPVALEGALKLKEISYIHAEGYPAAEMKHGPIALVDENMPVVFICPQNHTYSKIIANMEEIKARRGSIIALTNKQDEKINKLAENIIKVPQSEDEIMPIINTIPLQLLAYYIADLKGINPDKPKNLAKSVTVE